MHFTYIFDIVDKYYKNINTLNMNAIEVCLPANLKYSAAIRTFGKNIMEAENIQDQWISRLVLVLDEIFSNAVKYGSKDIKNEVQVKFIVDGEHVNVSIEDTGTAPKKANAHDLMKKLEKKVQYTDDNGRGLPIIARKWTDAIEIKNKKGGGITVSFQKSFLAI